MGKVIAKRDTPHQCFARLELNNGDQVMISVAQSEVKVIKMNWAGMLPGPTLWKSGSGAEIAQKFFDETKLPQRLIDAVIDRVIDCRSAADVVARLSAKPDDVLSQYAVTLEQTGNRVIRDVSELPYPKDLIKSALRHHLKNVNNTDKKAVDALEVAYVSLSNFQPLTTEERDAVLIMEGLGDTSWSASDMEMSTAPCLLDATPTALRSSMSCAPYRDPDKGHRKIGGEGVFPLFKSDCSLRTELPDHTSTHPGTVDVSGRVWIGPVQETAGLSTREGTLTNSAAWQNVCFQR
jgi:hypothetical protein